MPPVYREEPRKLDFLSHLEELRRRIFFLLAFFIAAAVIAFTQGDLFLSVCIRPLKNTAAQLIFISPTEAFAAYLKIAFLVSFVLSFPVILYHAWAFLHPAFPRELRKRIAGWLFLSLFLFVGGVAFSYFIAIPAALKFLIDFGTGIAEAKISVGKYISFFGALIIVGGVVFEIPVVMGFLADTGIVRARTLRKKRPQMLIAIMILAAVITPTQDIINMLMFALPMVILYEGGILIALGIEKRKG